ncbi:MAG: protein kinase, partial [Planctomycetota bacterium]
ADPPYYVMEYLENGSLEDMIRAQGSLSVTSAAKLLREIAEGLSYAHSKGVLHCDLKPANVMLDQDFRPRLGDFGQSRMSDDLTPSLGTLFFMAPEQADLEAPPDAAWDVYALGAIGYSMLVGSPPYRTPEVVETLDTADSIHARLQRYRETIRGAKKPKLHYKRSGIDKSLCQIIDRCLSPEPADRYANIQQVIEALDSRNRARTRRPIYLLGILGPLLLLPLMLLFSTKSIRVAQDETIQELSQQAIQTNKYTCRVAAKTLESEIASLFGLIEDEASEAELKEVLNTLLRDGRDELKELAEREVTLDGIAALKTLPAQQAVNQYLQRRLENIVAEQPQRRSLFNSIFLNDERGTNCGIFFIEEADRSSTNPVGQNFAWRSYFNGGREDADRNAANSRFQPLRHPHLSAHFLSTSTGKWKVGISAPIWKDKRPESDSEQPLGVLVLTINLGNFELLTSEDEGESNRFASLVDGRKGDNQGTLIQHPLLSQLEAEGSIKSVPRIDPRILELLAAADGIAEYRDPTTKLPGGKDFEGDWIAALQAVRLPASTRSSPAKSEPDTEQDSMSDLWVLVQQRSSEVRDPVDKLGTTLMRETYLEFAALLGVMLVLWFFVFRLGKDSLRGGKASGDMDEISSHSTLENT